MRPFNANAKVMVGLHRLAADTCGLQITGHGRLLNGASRRFGIPSTSARRYVTSCRGDPYPIPCTG